MEKLIIFILSTASLAWIFNKSKLFQGVRMSVVTKKYLHKQQDELNKSKSLAFRWFDYLDSLLTCVGCMGVYTALFCYLMLYVFEFKIICYALAGSMISLLFNKLIKKDG